MGLESVPLVYLQDSFQQDSFQSILLSKPLFFQTRSGSRGDGFPVPSRPLRSTGADHVHTALSPVLNRCCIPRIPPLCLLSSTGQPGLSLAVPLPFLPVLGWSWVTKASTVHVHEARAYHPPMEPTWTHVHTHTHTGEQLTAQHPAMSQDLFGHSNGNNSSGAAPTHLCILGLAAGVPPGSCSIRSRARVGRGRTCM